MNLTVHGVKSDRDAVVLVMRLGEIIISRGIIVLDIENYSSASALQNLLGDIVFN